MPSKAKKVVSANSLERPLLQRVNKTLPAKKAATKIAKSKPKPKPKPEPMTDLKEIVKPASLTASAPPKPAVKYGYSINFAAPAPEAAVVPDAGQHKASHKEQPAKAEDHAKASATAGNFAKEESAVKEAETIDANKVEHIKYSDKDAEESGKAHKSKDAESKPGLAQPEAKADGGACGTGSCGSTACADGSDKSAFSFKAYLQALRAVSLKDVGKAIASKFTVKNMQACMATILIWIDASISFITVTHAEDRNEVMQRARMPILFGMWICIFTFIIGGFWAGFAPLDSVSHATGIVVTLSKKQVIQGPKEGGIIKAILVKEGEHVKAGQMLAKIDDVSLKAQVDSARVQKDNAEKQLQIFQESLAGYRKLEKQGFVSRMEMLKAESAEADAQNRLSSVNSELLRLEESLDKFTVKSPINGVVTQIDVHTIGASIGQGQALMTITPSEEDLILEGYVSQQHIESVHVGLRAQVKIQAFKHRSVGTMDGIVTYVSHDIVDAPMTSNLTRQGIEAHLLQQVGGGYKVRVSIDKAQLKSISKYKDYELAPGMMADISIVTGERTMLQYLLDPLTSTFAHAFTEK